MSTDLKLQIHDVVRIHDTGTDYDGCTGIVIDKELRYGKKYDPSYWMYLTKVQDTKLWLPEDFMEVYNV